MTKVFTVYDSKAEAYLQPFIQRTKGEAIRGFSDTCQDEKSMLCMHPEDYTLFEIGTWDEITGQITMHPAKVSLGVAIEFKKEDKQLPLNLREAN